MKKLARILGILAKNRANLANIRKNLDKIRQTWYYNSYFIREKFIIIRRQL